MSLFYICISDNPIDISRWVKVFAKLKYYLPSHVCSILVTCCHYVFVVCLQSGGGWGETATVEGGGGGSPILPEKAQGGGSGASE